MRARPLAAAALAFASLVALAPPSPAAGHDGRGGRDSRDGGRLGFELVAGKAPKLDGLLKDWPVRPAPLGANKAVRVALAYDDDALYVAFDVSDDRLARTSAAGPDDDHASLSLAFPEAGAVGRYASVELSLFPGDPGNLAGVIKDGQGVELAGSRLVEAPRRGGYTFEAKVPWRSLPPAARVRCGLRALLRYHDGDGGRARVVAASSPEGGSGATGASGAQKASGAQGATGPYGDWARLETEPERAIETVFAREKKLRSPPQIDLVADVAGDALAERVMLWDHYLLVAGPRFRDGRQFYFNDLGEGAKPGALEVVDLTGDGKAEFVVRKRVERGDRWSELVQVLSFSGDAVATIFEHEVAAGAPAGEVSDEVRLAAEPGSGRIEIGHAKARGLTAASFGGLPDPASGVLVPWGSVRTRVFRWQDGKFVKASEDRGAAGSSARAEPGATGASARAAPGAVGASSRADAAPSPAGILRPPGPGERLDEVLALYRRDRRIRPADKPRFDFVVDVAGDARPERVLTFGKDLVVLGPGFREGRGYASLGFGFARPDDVLDVTARDLDGDGKAELVVRGRQELPAPRELGKGTIERELLLIYTVRGDAVVRAFALETGLSFGPKRVASALVFMPEAGKGGASLLVQPGRASGWTHASWPFPSGASEGGFEPLLLPWESAPRRYRWRGASLARSGGE